MKEQLQHQLVEDKDNTATGSASASASASASRRSFSSSNHIIDGRPSEQHLFLPLLSEKNENNHNHNRYYNR